MTSQKDLTTIDFAQLDELNDPSLGRTEQGTSFEVDPLQHIGGVEIELKIRYKPSIQANAKEKTIVRHMLPIAEEEEMKPANKPEKEGQSPLSHTPTKVSKRKSLAMSQVKAELAPIVDLPGSKRKARRKSNAKKTDCNTCRGCRINYKSKADVKLKRELSISKVAYEWIGCDNGECG
eukprot:gene3724-4245_t